MRARVWIDDGLGGYVAWLDQQRLGRTRENLAAVAGANAHGDYLPIEDVEALHQLCERDWRLTKRLLAKGVSPREDHERGLPRYRQVLSARGIQPRNTLIAKLADPDTGYVSADDLDGYLRTLGPVLPANGLISAAKNLSTRGVTARTDDKQHGLPAHLAGMTSAGMTSRDAIGVLLNGDSHAVAADDWAHATSALSSVAGTSWGREIAQELLSAGASADEVDKYLRLLKPWSVDTKEIVEAIEMMIVYDVPAEYAEAFLSMVERANIPLDGSLMQWIAGCRRAGLTVDQDPATGLLTALAALKPGLDAIDDVRQRVELGLWIAIHRDQTPTSKLTPRTMRTQAAQRRYAKVAADTSRWPYPSGLLADKEQLLQQVRGEAGQ